ncbi:MAG: peptidase [Geobacteraceae bacterium GWC2_58_44]|nr:MAG: peptidase [Geobacteraceae bacterium GWC2_58_44]HBG06586.1 peptidase [Geobacter sp.]
MSRRTGNTLIVCIGNELVADDAVGFELFHRLKGIRARLEYCSVGGIDLLPLLGGETDLVVVDAVQFGSPPGTIHCIDWKALPRNDGAISSHGLGLRETVEIGRILFPDLIPGRITLVGIEGRCFDRTREFMTPEVSDAIDPAVIVIKGLVGGQG